MFTLLILSVVQTKFSFRNIFLKIGPYSLVEMFKIFEMTLYFSSGTTLKTEAAGVLIYVRLFGIAYQKAAIFVVKTYDIRYLGTNG